MCKILFLSFIIIFNISSARSILSKASIVKEDVKETKKSYAKVVVDKAIIYADSNLKAAIGHTRLGKIIRVGNRKRAYGTSLPVIINRKVAYISVKDIVLEDLFGKRITP